LYEVPPALRELSDCMGTDNRRLVFSYLAIRRAGTAALPEPTADVVFRLVSAPLVEKGKRVIWGCGAFGRLRLVRLDRDACDANRAFAELDRGDRVVLRPPPGAELEIRGDGLRIGPGVRVEPVTGP